MSHIIDLNQHRRARDPIPQAWRHRTIEINDYSTLHEVAHEHREVVAAGVAFFIADVETFGAGGWGVFNEPRLIGSEYIATGITVRFPE